jgi:hypothetical protein
MICTCLDIARFEPKSSFSLVDRQRKSSPTCMLHTKLSLPVQFVLNSTRPPWRAPAQSASECLVSTSTVVDIASAPVTLEGHNLVSIHISICAALLTWKHQGEGYKRSLLTVETAASCLSINFSTIPHRFVSFLSFLGSSLLTLVCPVQVHRS